MAEHQTSAVFCIMILFMFVAAVFIQQVFCFTQADAESAIQSAESELLKGYNAVYEAEKAGANVSGLLKVLNEAGWFLSEAKIAYINGDYDSAYERVLNCNQKLEGVVDQATRLKLEAEQANRMDFLINYVGSSVGSVAVVAGGYAAWILKKREKSERAI